MATVRHEVSPFRARRILAGALGAAAAALVSAAGPASAQEPAQPPPGFEQQPQQPPPGYGQAPPGYGQAPPGYGYPPPGYGYGVPATPVLGPKKMDYEEGDPIPPGYHVETKMKKGLLIGGACTFGALYVITALIAATIQSAEDAIGGHSEDFTPLYIPAVGPFITIGTARSQNGGTFLLAADGIAQSAGLAMAIIGIVAQDTVLIRNDVGKAGVRLSPVALGTDARGKPTLGVGLVGSM